MWISFRMICFRKNANDSLKKNIISMVHFPFQTNKYSHIFELSFGNRHGFLLCELQLFSFSNRFRKNVSSLKCLLLKLPSRFVFVWRERRKHLSKICKLKEGKWHPVNYFFFLAALDILKCFSCHCLCYFIWLAFLLLLLLLAFRLRHCIHRLLPSNPQLVIVSFFFALSLSIWMLDVIQTYIISNDQYRNVLEGESPWIPQQDNELYNFSHILLFISCVCVYVWVVAT